MENLNYKKLCKYCFDVLIYNLDNNHSEPIFPEEFLNQSFPLFVTWTTGKEKELRGCIGTFLNDKLENNLPKFALKAAFNDHRFSPIKLKEVKDLNCGISLLTNFEPANSPVDWEVGKHGIDIDFVKNGEEYGATFLPNVASDYNWDQKTTLTHLIRKAGFRGKLDDVYDSIKVKRYQAIKEVISYEEYLKM
jgi:uncharacterized protein (TIGR00296 family)